MRNFLGFLAITISIVFPTAVRVSAEPPPPIEPIVVSSDAAVPTTCEPNCEPQTGK